MAAIAATPGPEFELELTLGQVDFVNGPIRRPNLAKCAKQVSQLTEAESKAEQPSNREQECGTIPILVGMSPVNFLTMHMHRLPTDTDPSEHRLFAASLPLALGGAIPLVVVAAVVASAKCNAMSRQRGNEVCVTVRQKGRACT